MFGFGNFLKANRTLGELRLAKEALAKEKAEHQNSLSILNEVRLEILENMSILNEVRSEERTTAAKLDNYKKAIPNSDDLPYLAKIMEVIVKNIRFTDVAKVSAPLWQKYNKKS
jgi:hypothetical protein